MKEFGYLLSNQNKIFIDSSANSIKLTLPPNPSLSMLFSNDYCFLAMLLTRFKHQIFLMMHHSGSITTKIFHLAFFINKIQYLVFYLPFDVQLLAYSTCRTLPTIVVYVVPGFVIFLLEIFFTKFGVVSKKSVFFQFPWLIDFTSCGVLLG